MPPKKPKAAPAPGKKSAAARASKVKKAPQQQHTRLWLMYPPRLITTPVIWELGHRFDVVTNVRQASVTDEIGVVCLEIQGAPAEIAKAIQWLERKNVKVEPVEINVIES